MDGAKKHNQKNVFTWLCKMSVTAIAHSTAVPKAHTFFTALADYFGSDSFGMHST